MLSAVESSTINNTMLIQIAALAWIFLGESITGQELIGLALALGGVLLVQIRSSRQSTKPVNTNLIIVFVSFHSRQKVGRAPPQLFNRNSFKKQISTRLSQKSTALFPTESDLLLSALEPYPDSTAVQIRVYDLSTTLGRLHGLLNSVPEAPAVIINGERIVGWKAAQLALSQFQEQAF
jgi:hypothetical protein